MKLKTPRLCCGREHSAQNALARATAAASLPRMLTIALPQVEETVFHQIAQKQDDLMDAFAAKILQEKIEEEEEAADYEAAVAEWRRVESGESTVRKFEEFARELGF
jgi:predicted kinase